MFLVAVSSSAQACGWVTLRPKNCTLRISSNSSNFSLRKFHFSCPHWSKTTYHRFAIASALRLSRTPGVSPHFGLRSFSSFSNVLFLLAVYDSGASTWSWISSSGNKSQAMYCLLLSCHICRPDGKPAHSFLMVDCFTISHSEIWSGWFASYLCEEDRQFSRARTFGKAAGRYRLRCLSF
jgi:hypothetical protein